MRLPFLPCMVLACTVLAASVPATLLAAPGDADEPALNSSRVGWERVGLRARKLFITATTVAEWALEDGKTAEGQLIESPQATAIAAGPEVLRVSYDADLPGIHSRTTLWMDPGSGNSLQYEIQDEGRRARDRIVRFTDEGAYHKTRSPQQWESDSAPATWTRLGTGFWPYGQSLAGTTVLDSLSLLYFIPGSTLARAGDEMEVLVFQSRQLVRLKLTADGLQETGVDYQATGDDGSRSCRGKVQALRVCLTVLPFGTDKPDFDFLGLKSDIIVTIEPQSRLPLQIEGRASIIGRVTSTLQEARLKGSVRCPGLK